MIRLTFFIFCFALAITAGAQPPEGKALPGDHYGTKVDPAGAESISAMNARLTDRDTLTVKVTGRVKEVCKQKGCWITIAVNDSTEAFVKMKDYGFFVPEALSGKKVALEGKAFVKTTSVAELKHYAEDGGKSEKEIAAIVAAEKQLRLLASGITVIE